MLYLRAKLFSLQLQLVIKFTVKEIYLFYVLFTTTITL
jgi:hypothetical protein